MSSTGTPPSFITVVESDFKAWVGDAESFVEGLALNMWTLFKTLLVAFTTDQAQIALNVFNRLEKDVVAGQSVEEIETDMLNTAVAAELAELQKIGSEALQAFIALAKGSTIPASP